MELHVTLEGRRDLAGQIYRQIRARILDGRVQLAERLPPSRELAGRLGVSRNTVGVAYEWLTSEGLVVGRTGAGSFVAASGPREGRARQAPSGALLSRRCWSSVTVSDGSFSVEDNFRVGAPDARLFPFEKWRWLMGRQIRSKTLPAGYGEPAGHPSLRKAIARFVGLSRGVSTGAEDVVVTQGAQQALDLIGRVLIEPGAVVAVEDPGYPPARQLFASLGAEVVGVPVDSEGLDVASLPDRARLVYVTPSHQFPLGMQMSHSRRTALLHWAARRNAAVIEDDYDSEFRFGGRPLETLQASDRTGRVIYVGSFSKTMLPALRLGFLVAPPTLRDALRAANWVTGWHCHWPAQGALAEFIDDGLFARHLRKMRREYSARHERILRALECDFASWLEPIPSVTGIHLCAPFRTSSARREREIAAAAEASGVGFDRLSRFYLGAPTRSGVVLGYGNMALARVGEKMRRLRRCFERSTRAYRLDGSTPESGGLAVAQAQQRSSGQRPIATGAPAAPGWPR